MNVSVDDYQRVMNRPIWYLSLSSIRLVLSTVSVFWMNYCTTMFKAVSFKLVGTSIQWNVPYQS